MAEFILNKEKAITSLLYICNKLGGSWDMYSLLKILYFAECKHLMQYGRSITGDRIIALEHGPVPSFAYDKVKAKSIDRNFFDLSENVIKAIKEPIMDYLSESEIECIDSSIDENKDLSFGKLKKKSHDGAYTEAWGLGEATLIPYVSIAKAAGANDDFIKYLETKVEYNKIVFE